MADPIRTDRPAPTPRALVAVPCRRYRIVPAAAVLLAASYGLARAAVWRRPGAIDPPVLDGAWIALALAVLPLCAIVARYRRRAPEFGVFREGIKLPFRRIPPGLHAVLPEDGQLAVQRGDVRAQIAAITQPGGDGQRALLATAADDDGDRRGRARVARGLR